MGAPVVSKVVIVGQGPRAFEHPEDAEVWVINGPRFPPRWDRLYQLHGLDHLEHKHGFDFLHWLAAIEPPRRLFMTRRYAELMWREVGSFRGVFAIPAAERFPLEAVQAAGGSYLTNSFPLVIEHAILEGAREITLDGVIWTGGNAQWGAGEGWAVPCVEYHLGRAAALGIKVRVPPGCGLFAQSDFVYGFEGPGAV